MIWSNGICKFTNDFVDDAKTGTRKMGKLIIDSVDWKKLKAWAKAEINFMKQWLKNNLGDDKRFVYATVHVDETIPHVHFGLVPITKSFSKSLNQDRYVLSNNRNFGRPEKMRKFHIYHTNYLTKSGFEILPGEKGSYNAASFREVKEIEKRRVEQKIESLIFQLRLEGEDYQKYQVAKQYQDYYEQRIQEVKSYLLLSEFNDFEKNQLTQYLQLLEKVRYYKIVNSSLQAKKQNAELLEHYQNELDIMTIRLENLLTKGYSLSI